MDRDQYWDRIYPALMNKSGTQVRDILRDANRADRHLFNELYWKVDEWLCGYLARGPLTAGERKVGLDQTTVGQPRLSEFLIGRTTGDHWQTADLPRLLAEIGGE